MIVNLFFCFITFSFFSFAAITIQSPLQYQFTDQHSIDFLATSTTNKGFLMVNQSLIPIREKMILTSIPLDYGDNLIHVTVFDEHLKFQPHLSQEISVYRSFSFIQSIPKNMQRLLTDLMTQFYLPLIQNDDAKLDDPILKKDLYAFLMWFYIDEFNQPLKFEYQDMMTYYNYLNLYQKKPQFLPRPILDSFYPDAYVTRVDFLNLLLLLAGSNEQISTSMIISKRLSIPTLSKPFVPQNWEDPMVFVTRREVLNAFFKLLDYSKYPVSSRIVMSWPNFEVIQQTRYSFQKARDYSMRILQSFQKVEQLENVVVSNHKNSNKIVSKSSNQNILLPKPTAQPLREIVVQPGDSIQRIARIHYEDPAQWKALADFNQLKIRSVTVNGTRVLTVHIVPGQKLKLFNL